MTLLLLLALVALWGGVLFALGAAAERERNVTVDLLLLEALATPDDYRDDAAGEDDR